MIRQQILADFLEETGIDLSGQDVYWGTKNYFFHHDGYDYYNKPFLDDSMKMEFRELLADRSNPVRVDVIKQFQALLPEFIGRDCGQRSLAQIRRVINVQPPGMPQLVAETEKFYKFETVGTNEITIDKMTRELLDKIQASFGHEFNPYYNDMSKGIYLHNDKIYWTQLNRWAHFRQNTLLPYKMGVFANVEEGAVGNYTSDHCYFFAFKPLNEFDQYIVSLIGRFESDVPKEIKIIDL